VTRKSSDGALPPIERQTRLERAWAGWVGAFPAALPLLFLMAPAVRLYARRFGLDPRTALAVNGWGAPWIRPLAALAAVEAGYLLHHQRFLGPADLPDWAAAGRVFGRDLAARLWDWVSGGFWLGLLAGGIVFLILLAGKHERS
jgi:hypothetical protein